ncbi:hypothetical protein ES703_63838 [subsurface metagenome]
MSSEQLVIPGLPPPAPPKPKKPSMPQQIANLEQRVIQLEADVTLLGAQLQGDKDHA